MQAELAACRRDEVDGQLLWPSYRPVSHRTAHSAWWPLQGDIGMVVLIQELPFLVWLTVPEQQVNLTYYFSPKGEVTTFIERASMAWALMCLGIPRYLILSFSLCPLVF